MDDDMVLPVEGRWGTVDYAVRSNGSQPARDDLERIKCRERRNYRRLMVLVMKLAEVGRTDLSDGVFSKLKGEIYGLRRHPYCMGCFFEQERCFITHVFHNKGGVRYRAKEIKKASTIRAEHLKWESEE